MLTSQARLNALTLCAVFAVAGCGGDATPSTSTAVARATQQPSATPLPSPAPTPGFTPVPLGAPLMVQVENLSAARPQSGLSQADVVYEYQTEGGISRFTAVYFHLPAGRVGPVRSARLGTIKLLRIWEATLLYSGASNYVSRLLSSSGLRQADETTAGGTLFRVSSRYAPHNLYTDGGHLAAFEGRIGPHVADYQLWARTTGALPPGGTPLARFQVPISQSERPSYTYEAGPGRYLRTEPDTGPLTDANNGATWQPTTVAVLQMAVTVGPEVEDVSGVHGLDFGLVGSGTGQLAVGGQLYPITWTQSPSGPPQMTLASGQPAPIEPGQVLIELVPPGQIVQPR